MRSNTMKDTLKRHMSKKWHKPLKWLKINKKIIINDVFAFTVVTDIVNDHNLSTIDECRLRHD